MTALILAAGAVVPRLELLADARSAEIVIAADGGLRHARELGVTPDLLVGDLDSVTGAELASWPGLRSIIHPADKDSTDLELAVDQAIGLGARDFIFCGTFGGRPDQALAALLLGARLHQEGFGLRLDSGTDHGWILTAGAARLSLLPGEVFSVLALSPAARISITGARYEPHDISLDFGSGHGVSNVAHGPVDISVAEGLITVLGRRP